MHWALDARAQAPDDSATSSADSVLVQSARAAFERHDYGVALGLFERASIDTPGLAVRLSLARTRVALGQFVEAARDYRRIVADVDVSDESASARSAATDARDELAQLRPRIPTLEIALGDAEQRSKNVRLRMDGRVVRFGSRLSVDPGRHEIVASDADGERARLSLEIAEGEAKTVGMTWPTGLGRADKAKEQSVGGSSARRTLGVVALGVGATGLGVGTVTGLAALSRYSAAEAHCPANRCTVGAPYPEDGSAARTLRTISVAGYIVGAAGVGTWLGLLLTTPAPNSEHPRVSHWTPVVGIGSAGARYVF